MDDLRLTQPVPKNLRLAPHWRGSKSNVAVARILALLGPVERLAEPFGGTGIVVLTSNARRRLYGDMDVRLFRLAVALRDEPERLAVECATLPIMEPAASALWKMLRARPPERWTSAQFAWATSLTFGGRLAGRLHLSELNRWTGWQRRISWVSQRLQDVKIQQADWRESIPDGWAVYADPPYARSVNDYAGGSDVDYAELFDRLERQPVAVVSGWSESTKAPPGWKLVPSPRKRGRIGRHNGRQPVYRTECEWVWRAT